MCVCVCADVCSGEGTLSAFDIRKHKLLMQSELLDSGLLSLAVVKVRCYLPIKLDFAIHQCHKRIDRRLSYSY